MPQAYIRAKDAITWSGASPDDALKKCPFYVEIDKFMRTSLIASPSNVMGLASQPDPWSTCTATCSILK